MGATSRTVNQSQRGLSLNALAKMKLGGTDGVFQPSAKAHMNIMLTSRWFARD